MYESYGEFIDLLKALIRDLCPGSAVEDLLVDSIARCFWRLRRIDNAEQAKIRLELERIGPPPGPGLREGEKLEEWAKRAVDDHFREDALGAGLMLHPDVAPNRDGANSAVPSGRTASFISAS
jgi:hypothetical protein